MALHRFRSNSAGELAFGSVLILSMLALMVVPVIAPAKAQTQVVTATPGYINLGMSTAISVTAPAPGTYNVVVVKPNGASTTLPYTFTAAGQTQNATYGNSTAGFTATVNLVGTYNVFVEQGSTVLGSTSFYATNKLLVTFQMVTGGTCDYVSGIQRGAKIFAHIYVTYASNGATWNNNSAGWSVKALTPDGKITAATWDAFAKAFEVGASPNWNYTYVGSWSPGINASDSIGNLGTYKYAGSPFTITPATMSTAIQLTDAKSGQVVTSLYAGETINIRATITYPTNAEPVTGFVAPLDVAARGGVVTAMVGYGYFNATTKTFGGSAKNPGTLLQAVAMTYTGANGTWTGQYTATSLPTLPAGQTLEVYVTSSDRASPANTGLGSLSIAPSLAPTATTSTSTSSAPPVTTTSIVTTSLITTISQITQTIPTIAYAGMVILLALGLIIGLVLRMRR
jgi:hypothetical protein